MGTFAEDLLARAARLAKKPARKTTARVVRNTNAWPVEEEAILIKLYTKGLRPVEIAQRMDRTANAISIKLNRLRAAGIIGDRDVK